MKLRHNRQAPADGSVWRGGLGYIPQRLGQQERLYIRVLRRDHLPGRGRQEGQGLRQVHVLLLVQPQQWSVHLYISEENYCITDFFILVARLLRGLSRSKQRVKNRRCHGFESRHSCVKHNSKIFLLKGNFRFDI